ncbi:MAG: cell division protein BolA [Gammaproteobacteria bacterium]|nr:cell division protein BolA [Gammaproteobacteria bacterium]
MTVCAKIKGVTRSHEWIADLFSLLAVVLLFATIWVAIEYQRPLLNWMSVNVIFHVPIVVAAALADAFLIIVFLNIGSSRFSEGRQDESCFGTFPGRRQGGASIGTMIRNWVSHMEHVNKKHR